MQWSFKLVFELLGYWLSPRKKALAELRAKWGKSGDKQTEIASSFYDLTWEQSSHETVDDQTWSDLEFPQIFSNLDTTVTPLGSQYLFKQMRIYARDPDSLTKQYQSFQRLRTDDALREEIQLKLMALDTDECVYIADSIYGDFPQKRRYVGLVPYWGLASVLILLAVIFWSWPVWIWLLVLAINVLIIYRTSWNLNRDVAAMKSCLRMLGVANKIASIESELACPDTIMKLRDERKVRSRAGRAMRLFSLPRDTIIDWILVWLNLAFLTEIIAYLHSIRGFKANRSAFASTFELVGSLDAATAMACMLKRYPDHCQPVFSEQRELIVERGYHPLLQHPVKNSVSLNKQSALVVGSNMAGKTTFIKMLGVNAILGQTLGVCLADRATLPRIVIMASISDRQSVASGKSHYFAEVERIHEFLDRADRSKGAIFIIDELFSGTNTAERLAICRAVLEFLGRNAMVLVTTHDVELQGLLNDHYQLFHFQENPDVEGFFDYVLRHGATTQRNAIRLLERMKFPAGIIVDAMKYVNKVK